MAITRAKKEKIVEEMKDKFGRAKTVVFAKYKGLAFEDFKALRKKLKESDAEGKVAKNSLLKIALKNKTKLPENFLRGQIATFLGYGDEIAVAKMVKEATKENKAIVIRGGIFEGEFIEDREVERLASIPSKEILLGKLVGSLNAPVSGFVNVLGGNIRSLLYTLNAIKEKSNN